MVVPPVVRLCLGGSCLPAASCTSADAATCTSKCLGLSQNRFAIAFAPPGIAHRMGPAAARTGRLTYQLERWADGSAWSTSWWPAPQAGFASVGRTYPLFALPACATTQRSIRPALHAKPTEIGLALRTPLSRFPDWLQCRLCLCAIGREYHKHNFQGCSHHTAKQQGRTDECPWSCGPLA